ncbi:MAG TPA: radical SAM protein [Bryobacteraceae bacterium]|nr:radical SAM protein [Bryobacteraceae bacterium]
MLNVSLLFPTGTDPRSPYLALPSLAAYLRQAGIRVNLHDLDIGGVHYLLEPENLKAAGQAFRSGWRDTGSVHHRRLAILSEELPGSGPLHLASLRDGGAFFDSNEWCAARAGIMDALDICSAARDQRLRYSIDPIGYDIDGVDPQSLRSLIEATQDDRYNLFAEYWERSLYPSLEREAPVFVGITITNRQQMLPGLLLARRLRERGYFVVVGGALITKFAKKLPGLPAFFETFANAVVAYEGETASVALAEALAGQGDLSRVPNLIYPDGGVVRTNVTHVEDVASLPTPDFTGLPLNEYLSPLPVLPVLLGKGCYFNRCKFCDIPYINHVSKKAYRLRSAETVVRDLRELNRKFDCRHFEFTDEALPPRTLAHLADELLSQDEKRFHFVGYARLEPAFTGDMCQKLADVGFRKLYFGLESACQATLDHMDKGIRAADVPAVLRNCQRAGIYFHIFSILGFPEETPEQAMETVRFFEDQKDLLNIPGVSFDVHPFGLELRTEYAEKASSFGVLISPDVLRNDFTVGAGDDWTNTRGLGPAEAFEEVARADAKLRSMFTDFHRGPQTLWPGFEEYAVLYSDHYAQRAFPFRSSLPDDSGLGHYSVRWHPGAVFAESEDGLHAVSRFGSVTVTDQVLNGIEEMSGYSLQSVLDAATKAGPLESHHAIRTNFRAMLNKLMAEGIVQLVPFALENHGAQA